MFKRTGWIRAGIDGPESIADHMYRMGMMALIAGDAGVDGTRYSFQDQHFTGVMHICWLG